jgi:Transglycosylase SLT domain
MLVTGRAPRDGIACCAMSADRTQIPESSMMSPGNSVATMSDLINENNSSDHPLLTDQLLMAIFWEESLFNNIKQTGGTAIGFGQMEPAELARLNKSGDIQADVNRILSDPGVSVDAAAQMLDALFSKFSKDGALKAYAGFFFKKDAAFQAKRQLTITGWTSCERTLLSISQNILDIVDDPDATIRALKMSRAFNPDASTPRSGTWRDVLFPSE